MAFSVPRNMGAIDQWLRLCAGFVLILLAGMGIIGPWGYLGVLPMLTAMVRYCPLYHALGVHTGHLPGARHSHRAAKGPP